MDAELKQYLIEMEVRMVSSLKDYVSQRCEQVETSLLTKFHKWASPAQARNRSIATALRALDLEMEAHEDRIKKLEGRRSQ
jgi:hypothetical protein